MFSAPCLDAVARNSLTFPCKKILLPIHENQRERPHCSGFVRLLNRRAVSNGASSDTGRSTACHNAWCSRDDSPIRLGVWLRPRCRLLTGIGKQYGTNCPASPLQQTASNSGRKRLELARVAFAVDCPGMKNRGIDAAETFACKILLASREINECADRLLQEHEVTPSQSLFIYYLRNGERYPSQIARKMGIDASNLSRMIRLLEQKGVIERRVDNSNRSRAEILLTKKGRVFAPKLDTHADVIQEKIMAVLTAEEQTTLSRALAKIEAVLSQVG